jgi:hypothetical protein
MNALPTIDIFALTSVSGGNLDMMDRESPEYAAKRKSEERQPDPPPPQPTQGLSPI